jgi:hypothetical protein
MAIGLVFLLSAVASAPTVAAERQPVTAAPLVPPTGLDTAGISLVGPDSAQAVTTSKNRADWDKLTEFVYLHREDFGYPWVDPTTGAFTVRPVTKVGIGMAQQIAGDLGLARAVNSESSTDSIADLEALADDLTRIDPADVPDSGRIWMTEPDHQHNRIIATIEAPGNELMKLLATRFGTTRVAIRIADVPISAPNYDRNHDQPPFYGGAQVTTPGSLGGGCTVAFAWTATGGAGEMLSAGHCFHSGGCASYPGYSCVGNVTATSEENWSPTTGTTYFPGQSTYRGDVALIRYATKNSDYWVFDGLVNTSTHHKVMAMHGGYLMQNDRLTTNGSYGGPFRGIVTTTGITVWYDAAGPNVYARNVVKIMPDGGPTACPIPGDSGGPAYSVNADLTLTAMGVYSGRTDFPGGSCVWYITDIRVAYYGLPGTLLVP